MYTQSAKQNMSDHNLGFLDRQIRLVVGSAMIIAVMLNPPELMGIWGSLVILAAIPVVSTGIIGWDPFYAVFGKSSYIPREEDIHQRNWMYSNVGIIDRTIRLGIGAMLLINALSMANMPIDAVLTLLAIPLIATAITAWDPIYALFGLNSFATRVDAEVAEPGANEQSLAEYYEFPKIPPQPFREQYAKAA